MLKFSKKDKNSMQRIHLLSGKPLSLVREFYEAQIVEFILSFIEESSVNIPLLGEIKINYLGDKITPRGKKANIDIDFVPNDFFIREVGLLIDGEPTDIEEHIKERIKKVVYNHLSEDIEKEEFSE